jgi:hypothetical protein
MHHGRTPRNMCIADADICSPHELFGTYRRKCTGLKYVRLHGTWYRRDSGTQSSCGCALMRRIPCNSFGNPFVPSHVRQSHSKRRPCFDLNFPFLMLCLLQRPLQTPLMICQRSFETPLMDSSGLYETPLLDSERTYGREHRGIGACIHLLDGHRSTQAILAWA